MTRLALLFAVLAAPLAAQTAHLRVDAPAGAVLVDGAEAGAAGAWIAVAPGDRAVALVDDASAWDPRRADAEVSLAAGDSVSIPLALPVRVRIESVPIRALIVRQTPAGVDTLGRAPLTVEIGPDESLALRATLAGYEGVSREVAAGSDHVTLILPLGAGTVPEAALLPTQRSTTGRTLIDVGLAAGAVAAGALAVTLKFRADRIDDRYRDETSLDYADPAVRDQALALDRQSALALGVMQVGLGVLAVRFVLR
ncbi:hypothetical protein [Rubrivirga sp. IMCC45206]|uniref:hypothetical protein n=1 Tax=Rubrivirga sp. IMCC45206 TaxID=3391614 RepID=UPI00398FA0FC